MRRHNEEPDILEESILDDLEQEEVEDDDYAPEDDEPQDESSFDTVLSIDSSTVHPIDYLGKCAGLLKCRHSKPEEAAGHGDYVSVIRLCKGELSLSAFCDFISAVFYMTGGNAVKIAIDPYDGKKYSFNADYKFRMEKWQHCVSIRNTRTLSRLFGIFRDSPADEQEILYVLLRAMNARFRKMGKIGRLGCERNFIAKWNRKKKPVLMVDASGKICEIADGCDVTGADNDGYACVLDSNGKYAIAAPDGRLLGNRWFYGCDANLFGDYGLVAVQTTALRWNFIGKDGKFKLPGDGIKALQVRSFRNGYAKVFMDTDSCNFMDADGNYLMKEWGNYSGEVSDGRVAVKQGTLYEGLGVTYNYAKVPQGTLLLDTWMRKAEDFADGLSVVANKHWLYNVARADGSYLFSEWYGEIRRSECGLFRVRIGDGLYNVADKDGKFLLDRGYPGCDIVSGRLVQLRNARNRIRRSMFVLDLQTKRQYKGEIVKTYGDCGLYCIMQYDDSWNLMDADGDMLFNANVGNGFSEPEFSEGFFWTTDGTDCIRFDINGNIISSI